QGYSMAAEHGWSGGQTNGVPRAACHTRAICTNCCSISRTIDDAIWWIDDLSDSGIAVFWNDTTCFRMIVQNVCSCHHFISEGFRAAWIIAGDKTNDVA